METLYFGISFDQNGLYIRKDSNHEHPTIVFSSKLDGFVLINVDPVLGSSQRDPLRSIP